MALDWALNAGPAVQAQVFRDRSALRAIDKSEAQSIVSALPAEHRAVWARSVVDKIIAEDGPEQAVQFVNQFAGQPDHAMQMAHIVAKVAEDDIALAARWVEQIPVGTPRDGALSTIVLRESANNPASAAELARQIGDRDVRESSAGSVATNWLRKDPEAARRWIDSIPDLEERDNVLVNASLNLYGQPELQEELVNSISDAEKREQAQFMRGMMENRGDPEELLRRLDSIDMPAIFKQQIKAEILRSSVRGR